MTTNMIRKGLAVGSGVALASTLLVGAPANAAITQINLAPISGSGTGAILGGGFQFAATSTGAATDTLTFNVTGHDTVGEVLAGSTEAQDLLDGSGDPLTASDTNLTMSALSNTAVDDSFFFTDAHTANNPYIIGGLSLDESAVTDTTSLTVFAFVDSNNNGIHEPLVDGAKSNSLTITFHAPDEVDFSATQSVDVIADEVDITISSSDINGASVFTESGELEKLFNTVVLVNGTSAQTGDITDSQWDADENAFVLTETSVTVGDGDIVTTKVYPGEETKGAKTVRLDTASNAVDAYGAISVSDAQLYADSASASSFDLRRGDGQVTITMKVYDKGADASGSWDDVYLAGETVTWEIQEVGSTFDSKTAVTAGGLTLDDDSSSSIKPTSVTNASGTASLTIAYADLDDGDKFSVEGYVVDSGISAAAATVFEGEETGATYDVVVTNTNSDGSIVADLNSSITVNLSLRDNFGLAPAEAAKAKLKVTGGETAVEQVVTFPAGSGNASMTFTDTTASDATSNTLTVALENYIDASHQIDVADSDGDFDSSSDSAEDRAGSLVGQATIDIVDGLSTVNSVDFVTGSSHDDGGTAPATIDEQLSHASDIPVASVDTRTTGGNNDLDSAYATDLATVLNGQQETLVAKVTDEDGLGIEGASVTFSNADFIFADESEVTFGGGSLTVTTKSDGTATVLFASNVSGSHEVTVTSGGSSDTLDVDIAYANADHVDSIEVTSASTAAAGSTYTFTAMVNDENGNGVISAGASGDSGSSLEVTYDGPGLTVGELPTQSTSKGAISFAVLMGSNDSGTGTVTLTYTDSDLDGDETYELEVEFDITVGAGTATGDVEYGTQTAWTVNQGDGTAKVYVKFPEVGGKLRILHQTGGSGSYDSIYSKTTTSETMDGLRIVEGVGTYVVRTIDLADGTNRIRVSVDGEDIEVNGKDRPARYNE